MPIIENMIKKIVLGIFILIGVISCNRDDDNDNDLETEAICDYSNTSFNHLYNNLVNSSSNQDETTIDLETHSLNFEVSENKIICGIGHQSLTFFDTTPYLIEISDNTSNTLLYSDSHISSSSSSSSYISITPIDIEIDHSYAIKRIQLDRNGNIGNTIGKIVHRNLNFPKTLGELTITGSSFYGTGGPVDNYFSILNEIL
jgi:hypothetical protein